VCSFSHHYTEHSVSKRKETKQNHNCNAQRKHKNKENLYKQTPGVNYAFREKQLNLSANRSPQYWEIGDSGDDKLAGGETKPLISYSVRSSAATVVICASRCKTQQTQDWCRQQRAH